MSQHTVSGMGREETAPDEVEARTAGAGQERLTRDELAELLRSACHWIWETDAELRLSRVSAGFERQTGMAVRTVLGQSIVKLSDHLGLGHEPDAYRDALEAREPFDGLVYALGHGRPDCRWIEVSGVPRFSADGTFRGYRGTARNVTRLVNAAERGSDVSAMARREDEIARANQRSDQLLSDMQRALDAMEMGVVLLDSELKAEIINKAFFKIWALQPGDVDVGSPFRALMDINRGNGIYAVDDDQWEDYVAWRLEEIRGGDVPPREFQRADGCTMIYSVTMLSGGKRLVCYYDVTEMKLREAELARALEKAQLAEAVINGVRDPIFVKDRDLNFVIANEAFSRSFGLKPEEMVGRHDRDYLTPERVEGFAAPERRLLETGGTFEFTEEPDGSDDRWRICRKSRVRTDSGKDYIVGFVFDITEIKRREMELARALEKAQLAEAVINGVRDPIFVKDSDLNFVVANEAFSRMFGLTPEEMAGRHDRDFFPGEEAAAFAEPERRLLESGETYEFTEDPEFSGGRCRIVRKNRVRTASGKDYIAGFLFDITELKQRETELARALEQAKLAEAVLNSVANPIFVKDANLRFVLVNEAFSRLAGVTPPDMIGRKGGDFVPAEDAVAYEANERHVLETGENYEVEEDFEVTGIGRSRIVRKNRVRTASGNDYVVCSIFDVSELKRRETEAQEARRLLENVLESMPAGVIIYDRDDRFVFANHRLQASTPAIRPHWQPGETLRAALATGHQAGYFRACGDASIDALYDVDAERWLDAVLERYHLQSSTYERLSPDGCWWQVYDTRTEDGTFIGVRVDITELKQREEQLRETLRENEVFHSLIDNLPVAIYAKKADLSTLYVNRTWCELTGIPEADALGRNDIDFFGEQGEAFTQADREILAERGMREIEEALTAADGSVRHQVARKSAFSASDGSLYLVGSTIDVTEQKQREKELQEARQRAVLADRAKSEFLANMSHEIRTPMNGVLGMAELLSKTELSAKQRTFADIIVKSGNALLTIINDILDFSKIDAGQLTLDPAPFNLAEAVEDVATLLSTRAKEKDLELIVRIQHSLRDEFVGDVGRFRQIITNLVGNAVKFTETGHVLIDVNGEPGESATRLTVRVTDTGIGIPQDKLDLVFDKFSQVDASSTRRHEGTGLGLAITSRLVQMMGGEMGVESELGKGSTFWFTIELPNAHSERRRLVTPVDVTGARVLVVDDNAANRTILSEQMRSWSFDSCAAESGPEAIQVLGVVRRMGLAVDCIVLDYQMPGMNGAEVARIIRADPATADVPIVMLTSVDHSQTAYRDLAIEAHIVKPARSSELLEALVSAIQKHHARRNGHEAPEPAPIAPRPRPQQEDAGHIETKFGATPAAPVAAGQHGIDILVAEDNEVNQLVFTQILQETPYRFEIVGNGRLAVEAAKKLRPRMILMDISMPEMNGLEATGAIRKDEELTEEHVPVVGVTAHALKGDRERCLEAGMDDYLSKPISPKALLDKIARWIGEAPQARRAG